VDPALVVDVDDPDALAGAIEPLLVDVDRAARLGAACRELVVDRCSPSLVARARLDALGW
jgi:hypothetical protein